MTCSSSIVKRPRIPNQTILENEWSDWGCGGSTRAMCRCDIRCLIRSKQLRTGSDSQILSCRCRRRTDSSSPGPGLRIFRGRDRFCLFHFAKIQHSGDLVQNDREIDPPGNTGQKIALQIASGLIHRSQDLGCVAELSRLPLRRCPRCGCV